MDFFGHKIEDIPDESLLPVKMFLALTILDTTIGMFEAEYGVAVLSGNAPGMFS